MPLHETTSPDATALDAIDLTPYRITDAVRPLNPRRFNQLLRDGRRHDPLRVGTHSPVGDRCPRTAGPLPQGTPLCAGRSGAQPGIAQKGASQRPVDDYAGGQGPIRADAGDDARRDGRSVVLATGAPRGDLSRRLGQWRAHRRPLPPTDPVSQRRARWGRVHIAADRGDPIAPHLRRRFASDMFVGVSALAGTVLLASTIIRWVLS